MFGFKRKPKKKDMQQATTDYLKQAEEVQRQLDQLQQKTMQLMSK